MTFLSKKDDVTYEDNTLSELAIQLQELISSGINQEEIAILVRKNRNIPIIADYFDKNTPYRIISDEAFRLDASLAVSLIIDAIEYLVDPDNSVAKAQLALSYQHDILKKEIAPNTILFSNIDDYLPNEFTSQQNSLSKGIDPDFSSQGRVVDQLGVEPEGVLLVAGRLVHLRNPLPDREQARAFR